MHMILPCYKCRIMLSPQNIIYGFCKTTNPPKAKYLISLYRSEDLNVTACFTTSRERAGVPLQKVKHGSIKNDNNEIISYVFSTDVYIGVTPIGKEFKFPVQTVIRFDYCFKDGEQTDILSNFISPKVVCRLNDDEYVNLIYAMYHSDDTPEIYKPHFEQILFKLGKKRTSA